MNRPKILAAVAAAAGAAALTAPAGAAAPGAAAAQSGLSVTPSILETTARRGATTSTTVANTTGERLRITVRARPWRQTASGAVVANRSRRLRGVGLSASRFTLSPGARRAVYVTMGRTPRSRSSFGALDVVGKRGQAAPRRQRRLPPRLEPALQPRGGGAALHAARRVRRRPRPDAQAAGAQRGQHGRPGRRPRHDLRRRRRPQREHRRAAHPPGRARAGPGGEPRRAAARPLHGADHAHPGRARPDDASRRRSGSASRRGARGRSARRARTRRACGRCA